MTEHTFDSVAFRASFPAFASETKYPDGQLSGYFTMATCYIWPCDWAWLHGDCLQLALNLMTAHMTALNQQNILNQGRVGAITGATVDKVTVSLQAPPVTNGLQQWLSLTPYGLQLWALIHSKAVGAYVGGLPERNGFRRVGGGFGGGRW